MITRTSLLCVFLILLTACDNPIENPPGSYSIEFVDSLSFPDSSRKRSIDVLIWYPENVNDRRQLVLIAHGLGGTPFEFRWLGEYLASHGYIVAAPRFPFTNRDYPELINIDDLPNQPGDLKFVADILIDNPPKALAPIAGRIDPNKLAVVGHSFGGLTSYLSSFDTELRDERIAASVLIAAAGGDFLNKEFYRGSDIPILLMHGDLDKLVEIESTSKNTLKQYHNAQLVLFKGGSHLGFGNAPDFGFNPDHLACWSMDDFYQNAQEINFYHRLIERPKAMGFIDPSAPLPCSYPLTEGSLMNGKRMRNYSQQLILNFLNDALKRGSTEGLESVASRLEGVEWSASTSKK